METTAQAPVRRPITETVQRILEMSDQGKTSAEGYPSLFTHLRNLLEDPNGDDLAIAKELIHQRLLTEVKA